MRHVMCDRCRAMAYIERCGVAFIHESYDDPQEEKRIFGFVISPLMETLDDGVKGGLVCN